LQQLKLCCWGSKIKKPKDMTYYCLIPKPFTYPSAVKKYHVHGDLGTAKKTA